MCRVGTRRGAFSRPTPYFYPAPIPIRQKYILFPHPMKEYVQTINLKDDPDVIRQYQQYHAQPWPEVTTALRQIGVTDMKIYLLGRRLFMYMLTEDDFDPATDYPTYLQLHPRCQEWENLMISFQEKVPEAQPSEQWAMMEKVFQL